MKRILLLLMFGSGLSFSQAQTPISIDDTQTLQQLIEDELIVGDCADVSNITSPMNSQITSQGFNSYAAFDATSASPDFPFDNGIVLASNGVDMIPDDTIGQNGDNPNFGGTWLGDDDLSALINEPGNTNNATVIEFDFVPYVDEISFNYFLASDEWPSFVCNYADTFAFILSGPGISDTNDYDHDANPNTPDLSLDLGGLNIATLPGTNIPVSPTNIHDLTASCIPGALGEFAVPQLYDDAGEDDETTMYFGRTLPLPAAATVIPGETYTIKLAVADRQDNVLNSAVFLEAESFDLGDIDLGEDLTISGENAACFGETVVLDIQLPNTLPNTSIFWAEDGTIIPGENSPTLNVTQPGSYEAGVQIGGSDGCILLTPETLIVEFYPELDFGADDTFDLCNGETLTLNGEPANADIYPSLDYQWSKDGVELSGETTPTLTVSEGGLYELSVTPTQCDPQNNVYDVNLIDYEVSIADPLVDCIDVGSTVTLVPDFNNSLTLDEIENDVTYEWTTDEGVFDTPTLDISEGQEVSLTTTFKDCPESDTQTFTFFNNPVVDISGPLSICDGDTESLDGTPSNLADLTNAEYTWLLNGQELTGETDSTLEISDGGTYQVIVDNNGCETPSAEFDVELVNYEVNLSELADPCVSSGTIITLVPDFNDSLTQDEIDNQVTYEWTTDDGVFDTPTLDISESQEVTLTTTFKDCVETATAAFTLINNPVVDIAGFDVLCEGETNTLNATPMNLNDLDQDNLTYSWTLDGEAIAGDGPILDITEGGLYEVEVNNNACVDTAEFEVEKIDFTLSFDESGPIVVCTDAAGSESIDLNPIIGGNLSPSQQNQVNYTWSDGSNGDSLTVSESGVYTVTVDVNGNCEKSADLEVIFTETVQPTLTDAVKCPEDPVTLSASLSADVPGLSFQWSFNGNVLSNETGSSISVTEEGDYSLVVSNGECDSDPATANVSGYEVDNCVITQGISPNGDEFNNCMDLTWLSEESGIDKITVFNRYGRKVFEQDNYVDTFCGQDENGDELSTGTYFYVIELERESERLNKGPVIKGWVYINTEQ